MNNRFNLIFSIFFGFSVLVGFYQMVNSFNSAQVILGILNAIFSVGLCGGFLDQYITRLLEKETNIHVTVDNYLDPKIMAAFLSTTEGEKIMEEIINKKTKH